MASHWLDCLDPGPATRILTKAPGSIGRVYTLGSAGDTQDTPGATHQPVPLVPPLPGWGLGQYIHPQSAQVPVPITGASDGGARDPQSSL